MRRLAAALSLAVVAVATTAYAAPDLVAQSRIEQRDHLRKDIRPAVASAGIPTTRTGPAACVGGKAAGFSCNGVDLLSFLPLSEMGGADPVVDALGGGASDLWGWTDSTTEDEYVLMGKTNGTAFYRITDPTDPVFLGVLPNPSAGQLIWHDMKVYKNHAFIVSESVAHGMQVFDLTRLRTLTGATALTPDLNYPLGFSAHNIAINEETGYAYLVGGNNGLAAPDQCRSGLHMVDIRDPKVPVFAGCHALGEGKGTAGALVGVEGLSSYIHDTALRRLPRPRRRAPRQGAVLQLQRGPLLGRRRDEQAAADADQRDAVPGRQVRPPGLARPTTRRTFLMGDELDEGDGGREEDPHPRLRRHRPRRAEGQAVLRRTHRRDRPQHVRRATGSSTRATTPPACRSSAPASPPRAGWPRSRPSTPSRRTTAPSSSAAGATTRTSPAARSPGAASTTACSSVASSRASWPSTRSSRRGSPRAAAGPSRGRRRRGCGRCYQWTPGSSRTIAAAPRDSASGAASDGLRSLPPAATESGNTW